MSSVTSLGLKQVDAPHYVTVGDARLRFYQNIGTVDLPQFSTNIYGLSSNTSTILSAAGAVLRNEGSKIVSANRTFRKVQLLVSTGSVLTGGSDGVAGVATGFAPWLTGYVELPSGAQSTGVTPVARLG